MCRVSQQSEPRAGASGRSIRRPVQAYAALVLLSLVAAARVGAVEVELVGQWGGPTYAVAVQGQVAYIGSGPRLLTVGISDPNQPTLRGQSEVLPGAVRGVAVGGSYAYIADDRAGLQIIDISNPAAPQRVGGYDTSGYAYGVAVAGSYAYVADKEAGLQIINISNPTAPHRVGGYDTAGAVWGVAVAGSYAYVADYDAGLQIIDVSNPAARKRAASPSQTCPGASASRSPPARMSALDVIPENRPPYGSRPRARIFSSLARWSEI